MIAKNKYTELAIEVDEIKNNYFSGTVIIGNSNFNVDKHVSGLSVDNYIFKASVTEKVDPIVYKVIKKFQDRSEVGIEKYGTTLHENNEDNFLTHVEEELMDALLYIQKIKDLREELTELKIKLSIQRGYTNEFRDKYEQLLKEKYNEQAK